MRAVQREWERKIDAQQNQVTTIQAESVAIQHKIKKEQQRVKDHHMTKIKNEEIVKL